MPGKVQAREGSKDALHEETATVDNAVADVIINEKCNPSEDSQYIRTRHNNLRCFPICSVPHNQNSFCGQPITGKIKCDAGTGLSVIGSFRSTDKAPILKIGEAWNQATQFKDAWIIGSCIPAGGGYWRFTFAPSRKWQYTSDDRISKSELHVFTVYVLKDSACVAIKDSNGFHVIPIWTAEREKESLRRTRARQKLRDQPPQASLPSVSTEFSQVSTRELKSSLISNRNMALPMVKLLHTNSANASVPQINHGFEPPMIGYQSPRAIVHPQSMLVPSAITPNTLHQGQYNTASSRQTILAVQDKPAYIAYSPVQPSFVYVPTSKPLHLSMDSAVNPSLMKSFHHSGGGSYDYLPPRGSRHVPFQCDDG